MSFIGSLLTKYRKFREQMVADEKAAAIREEEQNRKYYLENYGAYHNADQLTQGEMLDVLWRVLKWYDYDASGFSGSTDIAEPAKQDTGWNDLDAGGVVIIIGRIFGFSKMDISDAEYEQCKTFGELADLIIRKAKEKKQKQLVGNDVKS